MLRSKSKKINKAWINDHVNDPYVRLAKREVPVISVGDIDLKGVPLPIPAYTTPTDDNS
jgi:hypothetical protein